MRLIGNSWTPDGIAEREGVIVLVDDGVLDGKFLDGEFPFGFRVMASRLGESFELVEPLPAAPEEDKDAAHDPRIPFDAECGRCGKDYGGHFGAKCDSPAAGTRRTFQPARPSGEECAGCRYNLEQHDPVYCHRFTGRLTVDSGGTSVVAHPDGEESPIDAAARRESENQATRPSGLTEADERGAKLHATMSDGGRFNSLEEGRAFKRMTAFRKGFFAPDDLACASCDYYWRTRGRVCPGHR